MRLWLIALIVIVVFAVALVVYFRRLPPTKRGMKQMARDPVAMARMAAVFEERERLLARAESITDDEIREGIERILSGDQNAANTWIQLSEKIGQRMEPFLLAALDDPRAKTPEENPHFNRLPPFEHLIKALALSGSNAAVSRLAPLLLSPHQHLRTVAALNIATVGSPAAVEPTLAALRDGAESVRSCAMMGVSWAVKAGHVSEPFRRAVVEALKPVAAGETGFNEFSDRRACETLMDLDRGAAISHLGSARCLRPENPHLSEALEVLNKSRVRVDPALLKSVLTASASATSATQAEHRLKAVRAEALAALALADPAAAEPMIEAALDSDDEAVRRGGVEGLIRLHGLPDPHALRAAEDLPGGFEGLPRPVQHVIASVGFENEVNNGGLSQCFFNSSGDRWRVALEAFREMGCPNCEDILNQAVAILGPSGTSPDRETRIRAYGQLSDAREKPLDELSSRFYKHEDPLDARRARYMVRHADAVRRVAEALPKSPDRP